MRDHMAQNGQRLGTEFPREAVAAQLLEAYQRLARGRIPAGDSCAVVMTALT